MIGLLHAYSRSNAGDGLLIDLALERLRRSGVARDEVVLVALDPDSFPEIPFRVRMGARGRDLSPELVPATGRAAGLAASGVAGRSIGRAARELDACEAFVGVGGGYLRSTDFISSMGVALNHLPQLMFAGRAEVPSVYLPQSIGPLSGAVGRRVARELRQVDVVCVRDHRSERELAGLENLQRIPDLAVLDIAERWDGMKTAKAARVGFVVRRIDHAPGYEDAVQAVARNLGDRAVWAVQAGGVPSKSDAAHYGRLEIPVGGELPAMLEDQELGAVVSARLHGALMALAAGVPAIHLAYDRKGPAAFADLGLEDWCFDVRKLDPVVLSTTVAGLLSDPRPFWEQLGTRVARLKRSSADLDALIRTALA